MIPEGQDEKAVLQVAGEYYEQVRRQIEHEDNLITQRLAWLMAAQSFLFTAYAIILNGLQPSMAATRLEKSKLEFCQFLPLAGIISAGLIYASILGGLIAIRRLRALWISHRPDGVSLQRPPIQIGGFSLILGQSAPALLPLALILMWLYLLFRRTV